GFERDVAPLQFGHACSVARWPRRCHASLTEFARPPASRSHPGAGIMPDAIPCGSRHGRTSTDAALATDRDRRPSQITHPRGGGAMIRARNDHPTLPRVTALAAGLALAFGSVDIGAANS